MTNRKSNMTLKKTVLAALISLAAAPAMADANLQVFLWDRMSSAEMTDTHKIEDHADRLSDAMGVTTNAQVIPAGKVTFNVLNVSGETEHEMVVSRLSGPDGTLPYDAEAMAVDEEAAGSLGEVSELPPGQSGTLSVTLDPGTYALYCNVPGHYAAGMWTTITVR